MCCTKIRHHQRHDSVDFIPLLKRTARLVHVDTVVADRGDCLLNHNASAHDMGIPNTIIRPKYESAQVWKTRGLYRKRIKRNFDWNTYHQRSKIETIFSVIKRMPLDAHIHQA